MKNKDTRERDIVRAWSILRQVNMDIPDDTLDFMKNAAIERLRVITNTVDVDYDTVENLKIYVAKAMEVINDIEAELAINQAENEEIEKGYGD